MCAELTLRFGYGRTIPWVARLIFETLRAIAGPDMILLRSPVELHGEGFKTVGEFTVAAGETVPFTRVHSLSICPFRSWSILRQRSPKPRLLAGMDCARKQHRTARRSGQPFTDHAEGADIQPDRRNCRCAHDLAS